MALLKTIHWLECLNKCCSYALEEWKSWAFSQSISTPFLFVVLFILVDADDKDRKMKKKRKEIIVITNNVNASCTVRNGRNHLNGLSNTIQICRQEDKTGTTLLLIWFSLYVSTFSLYDRNMDFCSHKPPQTFPKDRKVLTRPRKFK